MIEKTPNTPSENDPEEEKTKAKKAEKSKNLDSNGDEYGSLSGSEMRELIDEVEALRAKLGL